MLRNRLLCQAKSVKQPTESIFPTLEPISPCELEILVSVATPSLLGILFLQRHLQQWVCRLGEASEALFQGEQLPILTVPSPPEENNAA